MRRRFESIVPVEGLVHVENILEAVDRLELVHGRPPSRYEPAEDGIDVLREGNFSPRLAASP